ncbi:MAG TPA: ABC transporter substrate-binding protein [Frankiaceae bacterium]|jgi:ABC-type branched-subunit amino acid transport system substrate-binding protein|nr:ABC transporter substrate-binding protein [Frankiaceae bacterium]
MTRCARRSAAVAALALFATTACTGAKLPKPPGSLAQGSATPSASAGATATASARPGATAKPGTNARPGATAKPGGRPTVGPSTVGGIPDTGNVKPQPPHDVAGDLQLFDGGLNTRGITGDQITLCAHAALTYGAAFNTSADDFNVFWQNLNDSGGVYGRRVVASYENDNYEPPTAVQAATTCQGKSPFAILGGIGFDQIPAVRNWAESNKELYLYHDATVRGSEGKQYSFSSLPTVERLGEMFAQLAVQRFKGKKIGILYRNSEFWAPGFDAFMAHAKAHGLNIGKAIPVENKQANYGQQLLALQQDGTEVVWAWENALAATEMLNQAPPGFRPSWMVFPFNLTTQTIRDTSLDIYGVASWPAYSYRDYGRGFGSYAADVKEFERQYAKYRPGVDLSGVGGDLLFLNWVAQKALADLLVQCGPACTRNHFATILSRYKGTVRPNCEANFRDRGHIAGTQVNVFHSYRGPSGKLGWEPIAKCVDAL